MRHVFALLVLLALVVPATAAQPVKLRYANFPAPATFPCVQMERWAEEVARRTNGAVQVETYPGGTLLDARAMLRGVAQGQADIGCVSLVYHPGAFPFFELFGLPLGFASAEEASVVLWELFKAHQPKELARYKVLAMFASAPAQVMSTEPVATAADVARLTLRAAGSLSDVLVAMGGKSVSIPMSETPEALQKGVVKGVFSSWDTLKDLNYAERCRYGLQLDMSVYPFVVVMNKDAWNRLPAAVQAELEAYADEHVRLTGQLVDAAGREALAWAEQTHGFKTVVPGPAEQAAVTATVRPLLESWKQRAAARGLDAEAVLADVERFRAAFGAAQ